MPTDKKSIDDEIQHLLVFLSSCKPDSEEYRKVAEVLKGLYEARSKKNAGSIELETLFLAATNILGILLILNYEHLHIVTSKAISMLARRV